MPIGTRHVEHGLLLRDGRHLVLRIDGGGEWRLDAPIGAERLVGQRVTVVARRDGYDLLGVTSIRREGSPEAEPPIWRRWGLGFEALVVMALFAIAIGTAL